METNSPFIRPSGMVVLAPKARKNPLFPVVHYNWDTDLNIAIRHLEALDEVGVKFRYFRGTLQLRFGCFKRISHLPAPFSASHFSASIVALQPAPAAVMAWR